MTRRSTPPAGHGDSRPDSNLGGPADGRGPVRLCWREIAILAGALLALALAWRLLFPDALPPFAEPPGAAISPADTKKPPAE